VLRQALRSRAAPGERDRVRNYGEQNAHIVHGRDHDYPDIRSHAHNTFIKSRIADLAAEARRVIEEAEQKQVMRIKCLIREYYITKSEAVKRSSKSEHGSSPSSSRARSRAENGTCRRASVAPMLAPTIPTIRPSRRPSPSSTRRVGRGHPQRAHDGNRAHRQRDRGGRPDPQGRGQGGRHPRPDLPQARARAQETLAERSAPASPCARLEMTRNSLTTTWRQVRAGSRASRRADRAQSFAARASAKL